MGFPFIQLALAECQGRSKQKMNKTLAPFKTLVEVSDIQGKLQNGVFSAIVMAAINAAGE